MSEINWSELVEYREGKLYWKHTVNNNAKVGTEAGSTCRHQGYRTIAYKGKRAKCHRVIWELHHGPIPDGLVIDHIDHNRSNNLLENLRVVSHRENMRNRKVGIRNKTGVVGVHKYLNRYYANIRNANGEKLYLGCFISLEEAAAIYKAAATRLGYHPNHGVDCPRT